MAENISVADTAKKQDELLESFVNVRQYDMMLTYLEATLFQRLPRFHCPSSLVIDILFTLATLSDYNNADLLRPEFGNASSERPLHVRALAVLQTLIGVLKNKKMHSTKTIEGSYNPLFIEQVDLADTEYQLIHSLDFVADQTGKGLRSRALKVQRYYEKTADTLEELTSSPPPVSPKPSRPEIDLSPQKKRLQMELSRAFGQEKDAVDDDDDEDDWSANISDKKSAQILKNKRFDITLADGKIFNAIQWALHCSTSSRPAKREAWNMWRPVLTLVFDILELELSSFKEQQETQSHQYVSQTLTESFFVSLGKHNWSKKFMEVILPSPTDKVEAIFANEAQVAKSIHLVPQTCPEKGRLLSSDALPLLKKLVYLSLDWSRLRLDDKMGPTLTKISMDNIYTECALRLFDDGNFNDMLYWFHLSKEEISDKSKTLFMFHTLSSLLVQMITYKYQDFVQEDFIFVEGTQNIELLFENVTYQHRHYDFNIETGPWSREAFQLNYSRINLALFLFFSMWMYWTTPTLSKSTKKNLMNLAKKGQDARYKILTGVSHLEVDDSEIHELTDWLEVFLN